MKSFIILMILFFITYLPLFYVSGDQLKKYIGQNFVVCVVLGTLIGIYSPNIPIYFIAIVVLFLSTVSTRVDAGCRYILLAAFIPEILWQIGAAGHYFGTIDSAGALAMTAYVMARVADKDPSGSAGRGWRAEDFLVLTLFLIFTVGGVGFVKFDDSLRAWIQEFLLIVMPYALFRTTLKSTDDYRAAIACFGVASLFLAIFAIYEARMSADIFDVITKHLTGYYIRTVDIRGGLMRASATMGGPLALACFMTVGILALACSRDFFRNAAGYYTCLVVATLGLLATQSRGSLIAVLVSAVVLSLALRKWGIAAAAAVVAGAAWPTLQVLANVSPAVASFMNGGAAVHQGKYYDYRNLLLERGLEVAANHPLTGMRLTQVLDALADITQGEGIVDLVNVYLVILLISGIVGLLPFLTLTLTTGARGTFGFKRIQDQALLRARGFSLAAFTAVLFQLSFVSFIDRMPMVFVLTLCGIRLLVQQRQSLPGGVVGRDERQASPPAAEQWVLTEGDAPDREPWVPRLPMISA
jgi:hypothetical protein